MTDREPPTDLSTTPEAARRPGGAPAETGTSGGDGQANRTKTRNNGHAGLTHVVGAWLRGFWRSEKGDSSLRETLEEIIEESERTEEAPMAIGAHERVMLANILNLRLHTAYDVMLPRADICAVPAGANLDDLIELMSRGGHSRVPVYRETLDDVIGLVHIKDVLAHAKAKRGFQLSRITREVLFVAPSMPVLDLLLEMRQSRVHMALVVDEFGGVDGLITIEDLVEEIVGEIEDEHDVAASPQIVERPDGSLVADARYEIDAFEDRVGPILSEEERDEDIDTLAGLVVYLAGRVPSRGELIIHDSGVSFEVMEADPRRVKRLRIRNLPSETESAEEPTA